MPCVADDLRKATRVSVTMPRVSVSDDLPHRPPADVPVADVPVDALPPSAASPSDAAPGSALLAWSAGRSVDRAR